MNTRLKKFLNIILLSALMMSGCGNENTSGEFDPAETTVLQTEPSVSTVSETASEATAATVSETTAEEIPETEIEYGEYVYSPPSAALELEFVRDNIIHKLEYTYYRNDGTAELPEYIVSDINSYADEWISEAEYGYKLDWIGVDMFDINSDGIDDYIVVGQLMDLQFASKEPGDSPYAPVEIIYSPDGNGGFEVIDFPASYGKAATNNDHILSTKTNGYNDFVGSSHEGILPIKFDGESSYYQAEILGDDYTWEYLDNGLVKISCYDHRNENVIAVAKFLYDTGYTEHMLIYSSLPDGTPSGSIPQAYGDNKFEFYVKRTDKAPEKWNDWAAGPIEIKYIPADQKAENYDEESLAYKAAEIIHNEYLEYQNGSFEDWNIGNDEPDLICASALLFDMNSDGKMELLSQKYTGTGCYFYTIYDIDSGEMLFNYYGSRDNIYLDNGRIYLESGNSPHDRIFITVSDNEINTAAYEEISAGYTDGYFYIGSRISAVVCEYKKSGSLPKFEGTDSWCRYFSPESGFVYYEGEYNSQLENMNSDFESNFDSYEKIGEIRSIAYENYSDNGISTVWLTQGDVSDFDKLVEHLDFAF